MRDGRVVGEHVEPAKLVTDALRRGGDGSLIRYVELEGAGISFDRLGRFLPPRQIARTNQDREVLRSQPLCDLEADPLICSGDQSDGFVLHSSLLFLIVVWLRPPHVLKEGKRISLPFNTEQCSVCQE